MRNRQIALIVIVAGQTVGCSVGPSYKKPEVGSPSGWTETVPESGSSLFEADANWWKLFRDPELDSLVNRAVASNLDLKAAGARLREARAQYGVADADLGPMADASGSTQATLESHKQPLIGAIPLPANVPFETNVYQAGFDASWEIDLFGGTRRKVEAASAEVSAAYFGSQNSRVSLLGEVARNYIDVRALQSRLAIIRKNITVQEDVLEVVKERLRHGLARELDRDQAAAALSATRSEVPSLESALRISMHRLGVLMALPPGALVAELSKGGPMPLTSPDVPVGLPSELLLRRPDIRQAERHLAAATARVGLAKSDYFPKFYLTGGGGYLSTGSGDWFSSSSSFWSLGPTFQWRIFDAGRIRANIRVQDARTEQLLSSYEQTVLVSFEEVENTLVSYANERVRRESLQEVVNSQQRALAASRNLYSNGLSPFLDVLEAERSLYLAEDNLVQSDRAIAQDLVALYKALGGGWDSDTGNGAGASKTTPENRG